jgi:hypothetical protein
MTTTEIKAIQSHIGVEADGFFGPKSIAACQAHLRKLMPKPNPWPETDQASLTAFYGAAGDESKLVNLPAPVAMFYEGTRIKTIRCHKKVAESLARALTAAYSAAPLVVEIYDGCFNNRPMRGGSTPSLHARGAAIDLCADKNGNKVHWPDAATMPFAVMEAFAVEGWLSAGAFWGRDAMHQQATR